MKYKVIYEIEDCFPFFLEELETKINKAIEEGWKPQGGICYGNYVVYQAMIKED